ncbi:MAG: hypothetical protein M3Y21_01840 [Candidatus Eremiobacteraeota bacterium]|nr:hypothetical protein [Candidatus Eremiobacteraeota bacterium]
MIACVWLAGLWLAAPLLHRQPYTLVDRIRSMIVLGVALPFVLGYLALLSAPLLWLALALLVTLRFTRRNAPTMLPPDRSLLLVLVGVLLVAWPALVRPPLDGDTLLYHLPNAFTWAQQHSVWQTNLPEWYYPGASELFGSPLIAIGARFALPLCGLLPALLLIGRILLEGRRLGAPPIVAVLTALAFIWTPVAAFETGTMQNDLWLAAFFLEAIYASQSGNAIALAMSALLKPSGWVFALIAGFTRRAWSPSVLLAAIPLTLWVIRDAILAPHALVPFASQPPYWTSTIAGNLLSSGPAFTSGFAVAGVGAVLWLMLPVGAFFIPHLRTPALAGTGAIVAFVLLPLSYQAAAINYLANGSSLRFALPAMAVGAVIWCAFGVRAPAIVGAVSGVLAVLGAVQVLGIFWNDSLTHTALLLAIAFALLLYLPAKFLKPALAMAAIVAISYGANAAQHRALGFYADWMRGPTGSPTGVFTWLSKTQPPRLATWNVRAGAVAMISPNTQLFEVDSNHPCAFIRTAHAVLFIGTDRDTNPQQRAQRFAMVHSCGPTVYQDASALIVHWNSSVLHHESPGLVGSE